MDNINSVTGKRIRQIREAQQLSREKLAEYSGISTQFLADIETGKKGMTVNTLAKLCNALKVTADSVIFGTQASDNDSFSIMAMLAALPQNSPPVISRVTKDGCRAS